MSNWKLLIIDGESHLVNLDLKILDVPNFGRFPSQSLASKKDYTNFELLGKTCKLVDYSLSDMHSNLKRGPQIISPKDIAWLIYKSGLSDGDTVVEAGSGSAALTLALVQAVAPNGKVVTFESNLRHFQISRKNIEMSPWNNLIDIRNEDLQPNSKIIRSSVVIFDLPNPQDLFEWSKKSLKLGGILLCYLPTINQVENCLPVLKDWKEIEITEIIQRNWQPRLSALRPESTMLGHTGFIVSARWNG